MLDVSAGGGPPHLTFRYTVLRVWQESVASFLAAGPGLAPLAVLTNEAAGNMGATFDKFRARLNGPDVPGIVAGVLTGLMFMLSGLRYDEDAIRRMYGMLDTILEDSTSYQWVLKKGETKGEVLEARRLLVRLGTRQFGPPPAPAVAALDAVTDRERLERMFDATSTAAGWDDLLTTP